MISKIFSAVALLSLSHFSFSQIIVDDTPTPVDLVMNTLIGQGVSVSNITYTGLPSQRGYFNGTASNIGLPEGVILSSGNVVDCMPPSQPSLGQFSTPGDNDLLTVAQSVTSNPSASLINTTQDAAILEFDFVPIGDSVSFSFVFASEEYTTYINTQFNDAFGFFVSGPGITGPFSSPAGFPNGSINLANVPGTTDPITISTIHPGLNPSYYIGTPTGHSFNGFTVPIEISFEVICGETYHFKFAVTDCQDNYLDTGVFLEAGSFSSNSITVETTASVTGIMTDTLLSEACVYSTLNFIRPVGSDTIADTVPLYISGTVDPATDLSTQFIDTVFFPIGVDTVSLVIDPIEDLLDEPIEWLEIGFYNITPCGDSIYDSIILYITDYYPLTYDLVDTVISVCQNVPDSVEVLNIDNSIPPYSVQWSFGSIDNPTELPLLPSENDTVVHYVTITDGCGDTWIDSIVHYLDPQFLTYDLPDTVMSYCVGDSNFVEVTNFANAPGPYTTQWSFGSTDNPALIPFELTNNSSNLHYVAMTDGCGRNYSDSVYFVTEQTLSIDSFLMQPASCSPIGSIIAIVDSVRPNVTFDWTFQGDTNFVWPNQGTLNNLYGGWYVLDYTDNDIPCTVTDSVFVETINTPQAIVSATPNYGCSPLTVTLTNSSQNAVTYNWDFGNGNTLNIGSAASQTLTYFNDAVVQLTASNGDPNCDNTATVFIDIVECGCMDPIALNYNPAAVLEDGSCEYPKPTVIAPNVITDNGDLVNPFFFLQTEHAETIELTILNRWGNVLYNGVGDELNPPFWNATDKSGKEVEDGVYFYRYKVTGIMGDVIEGHGFVEVVR